MLEGTARKLQSLGSERRQGWGDRVRECVELPRHFARELRKKAALRKIDYFSPVLDSEYALALECNPWFRPSYTCWNYGTVEDDFSLPNVTGAQLGRNILVGNNATAENNHYEAFEIIKKRIDLAERKVIVPLSYGKSPYRDKVVAMGNELLGESFLPLVEYLPKEKYIECLSSCGIVFMNHIRQQALGNILISGLLGAKIFLNSQSPLYNWMRQRGFVVGDAAEIDDNPLSVEECQQNLDVIYEYWGRDKQHHRTSMMVQLALGAAAD